MLMAIPKNSYALSCKQSGNIYQSIVLDKPIKVSTASIKPGLLLWRSHNYTSTFQCTDDRNKPQGEDAFFHLDPEGRMGKIHNSLEVGLTYNNVDIKSVKGLKQSVGPATACKRDRSGQCQHPAQSLSVTLSYAVYIKATGNPPPPGGKIADNNAYAIFQLDGVLGLNSKPNSNFNTYISGLSNIQFISCNPIITILANGGGNINFGALPKSQAVIGKIEKKIPFSIVANMSGPENAQDCRGETLQASFSSANLVQGNSVIMPTIDSGYGIYISRKETPDTPIVMNTPIDLSVITGTYLEKNFIASFQWLRNQPKVGPFTATANVDVTFK